MDFIMDRSSQEQTKSGHWNYAYMMVSSPSQYLSLDLYSKCSYLQLAHGTNGTNTMTVKPLHAASWNHGAAPAEQFAWLVLLCTLHQYRYFLFFLSGFYMKETFLFTLVSYPSLHAALSVCKVTKQQNTTVVLTYNSLSWHALVLVPLHLLLLLLHPKSISWLQMTHALVYSVVSIWHIYASCLVSFFLVQKGEELKASIVGVGGIFKFCNTPSSPLLDTSRMRISNRPSQWVHIHTCP